MLVFSPGYEIIDRLLKSWGFKKLGRHWLLSEIDLEVEVPASSLGEGEEWAEQLIKLHFSKIDWPYLESRALKEKTLKPLKKLKKSCTK